MGKIEIHGGYPLDGSVRIQGSKNALLPILSACILTEGENKILHCPKIRDVDLMIGFLKAGGASVYWQDQTLIVNTQEMQPVPLREQTESMRASILFLGSFLGRFGKAVLGYPGGCPIGKRPIDLHIQTLSSMGVAFEENQEEIIASCHGFTGEKILLGYPSVGVTENLLLAAAKKETLTEIIGAAKEPEILALCEFLKKAGVKISGAGTRCLKVQGRKILSPVTMQLPADRIVAGTYLLSCAGCGGSVYLRKAPIKDMGSTIAAAKNLGMEIKREGENLHGVMKSRPKGIMGMKTEPYPGFPTDLQSPLLAVLCIAKGNSTITEQIFENRYLILKYLRTMGAKIRLCHQEARILGCESLYGCQVCAQDLRGGAALVLAGMEAQGKTCVTNVEMIQRGYEDIIGDLRSLGARIRWTVTN